MNASNSTLVDTQNFGAPQIHNEILSALGDEGAQRQLDVAKYLNESPSDASEVVEVPTPAQMVETAASPVVAASDTGTVSEAPVAASAGSAEAAMDIDTKIDTPVVKAASAVITASVFDQAPATWSMDASQAKPYAKMDGLDLSNLLSEKAAMDDANDFDDIAKAFVDFEKADAITDGVNAEEAVANAEAHVAELKEKLTKPVATEEAAKAPEVTPNVEVADDGTLTMPEAAATAEEPKDVAVEAQVAVVEAPQVEAEPSKKESVAYRIGYLLGKRRAAKEAAAAAQSRPIDPLLAENYDAAHDEVSEFAEVDAEGLTKLSNEELRAHYLSMDVTDQEGLAKVVDELAVRDWFLSLDNENSVKDRTAIDLLFGDLDLEIAAKAEEAAAKEAAVQTAFAELDAENAKKEAAVQEVFASLDADVAAEADTAAAEEANVQAAFADLDAEIAASEAPKAPEIVLPAPLTAEEQAALEAEDSNAQNDILNVRAARTHAASL